LLFDIHGWLKLRYIKFLFTGAFNLAVINNKKDELFFEKW